MASFMMLELEWESFCSLSCWETVQFWFETSFLQIWKTNIPRGEDYYQKNLVGVCGPFSKTLTIFMASPIIKYPDRCGWHRWRGFVHGFIDNDEKVASSKQHTQFKSIEYKNHTLFKAKMSKSDTLFMTKTAEKPCPWGLHII